MKDNFSSQSNLYAKYRPEYPMDVVEFIVSQCKNHFRAWDCATGNGQFASKIVDYFNKVYATDLSSKQLENAIQKPNIFYSELITCKEKFSESNFDLISVAQAVHWFQFETFYSEVKEKLNPEGIIALIGYGLLKISPQLDQLIQKLYSEILGTYWDNERRYIDEEYLTIPFPFQEIVAPKFSIKSIWTFDHLIGFFSTWSALQHYIKQNGINPVDSEFISACKNAWGVEEEREVIFPVYLRIGKV